MDMQQTTDHDLLIELKTTMVGLVAEVRQSNLQNQQSLGDHETRLRLLEKGAEQRDGSIKTLKWVVTVIAPVSAVVSVLIDLFWKK